MIGRLADTVNIGDGGSSDVWDLHCETVLAGLRSVVSRVVHDDGGDAERSSALAASADIAVVVAGYTYVDEGEFIGEAGSGLAHLLPPSDEPRVVETFEASIAALAPIEKPERLSSRPLGFSAGGDRLGLRLDPDDVELIRAVAAANPRTIVAIQSGSAVVMSEWIDSVPAVVQAWYGGCQAGPGLADVLVGNVNPSARLPFTIPREESDLPPFDRDAKRFRYDRWHGWWHLHRTGRSAAFPFGFGLSYTTFALVETRVSADGDHVRVSGAVVNTGTVDGVDVIQVYAELPHPDAPPRLVGFARLEIAGGAKEPFEIAIPRDRLASRDPGSHSWVAPAGRYSISVGRHAEDPAATTFEVDLV